MITKKNIKQYNDYVFKSDYTSPRTKLIDLDETHPIVVIIYLILHTKVVASAALQYVHNHIETIKVDIFP